MTFPKAYGDTVQRLRVPSGFVLLAAFLWFSRPTPVSLLAGVPVALAGMALRAWAAGHLRKNATLTTSGPYAWVRNPLYCGSLLAALGMALASAELWLLAPFALYFLCVYLPVIAKEEQKLRELFPGFDAYSQAVPMLLPRPPRTPNSDAAFAWRLYMHNREYKAGLAWLAAMAVLSFKL